MKQRSSKFSHFLSPLSFIFLIFFLGSVNAYKNFTVGDSLGWYDNQQKPDIDYQKWSANKKFSLGDSLLFNTDTNHSVVQTYNSTTYKLCNYDDDLSNATFEWSAGDPSATTPQPVSVSVYLTKQGMNYFFSGDYDGEQCKYGQHFAINVTHGQGLPVTSPGPDSGPQAGDDESAPDTIVPSNFDHPKDDEDDDDVKNDSGSVSLFLNFLEKKIYLSLILLWFGFGF